LIVEEVRKSRERMIHVTVLRSPIVVEGIMNKKIASAGLLVLFIALLVKAEKKRREPLLVVPTVDLERYAGLWYEIARLPNRFENKCALHEFLSGAA
jgi:hypothetical protein